MKKKVVLIIFIFLVITGFIILNKIYSKNTKPTTQNFIATSSLDPAQSIKSPSANADVSKINLVKDSNCQPNFACYMQYYSKIVRDYGITTAFDKLKQDYNKIPYVMSQCHQMTHVIGRAAVETYPDVSEAYKHGDSFCWSGYYHGVMEAVIEKLGPSKFPADINDICKDVSGKDSYSFEYFNCVHGLGHGVMDSEDDDLPKSLKICDMLDGSWEQTSCYGGVFMENVMVDNRGEATQFLRKDEPLYPCTILDSKYKEQCYLMQTSYLLKINGGNFTNGFSICEKADTGFDSICYQSLGRDASSYNNYDINKIKATCMLGRDTTKESNCIIGAVKDIISYFHSDKEATDFCNLFEPDLEKICSDTKSVYYKSF